MTNRLLEDDHRELDRLLEELFEAFAAADEARIFHLLDLFWARLAMHIRAEHLHLFPALLRALETPGRDETGVVSSSRAGAVVAALRADHNFFMRELAEAVGQLRPTRAEREDAAPPDRIGAVRATVAAVAARLAAHNETEESEVYGWAEKLLDRDARAALNDKMRAELANLPPRFRPAD